MWTGRLWKGPLLPLPYPSPFWSCLDCFLFWLLVCRTSLPHHLRSLAPCPSDCSLNITSSKKPSLTSQVKVVTQGLHQHQPILILHVALITIWEFVNTSASWIFTWLDLLAEEQGHCLPCSPRTGAWHVVGAEYINNCWKHGVCVLAPLLTSCLILGKLFNFSVLQFLNLKTGIITVPNLGDC